MATKVTESSLTCSICLRRFRKPRALPCLHSYCEECLIEYAPKGTQVLMCPLCQKKIQIPDGDVTKFQLDFRLQSQVEDATRYEKEAGIVPEVRVCTCCKDEDEAIATCRKCGQLLCNFGVKAHENIGGLRDHEVIPLTDVDNAQLEELISEMQRTDDTTKVVPPEKRALLVSNIPDQICSSERMRDRLAIHFLRKRNGGGDIDGILYPLEGCPQKAVIAFVEKEASDLVLQTDQVLEEFKAKVTVELLPQVFNKVDADIDSFYWNLVPRLTTTKLIDEFSKTYGKKNLQTAGHILKKITCTMNQLDNVHSTIVRATGLPVARNSYSVIERGMFVKNIPYLTEETEQLREELRKHLQVEGVCQLDNMTCPVKGNVNEAIALFVSSGDRETYIGTSDKRFFGEALQVSRLPPVFRRMKAHLADFFLRLLQHRGIQQCRGKLQASCGQNMVITESALSGKPEQLLKATRTILEMIGLYDANLIPKGLPDPAVNRKPIFSKSAATLSEYHDSLEGQLRHRSGTKISSVTGQRSSAPASTSHLEVQVSLDQATANRRQDEEDFAPDVVSTRMANVQHKAPAPSAAFQDGFIAVDRMIYLYMEANRKKELDKLKTKNSVKIKFTNSPSKEDQLLVEMKSCRTGSDVKQQQAEEEFVQLYWKTFNSTSKEIVPYANVDEKVLEKIHASLKKNYPKAIISWTDSECTICDDGEVVEEAADEMRESISSFECMTVDRTGLQYLMTIHNDELDKIKKDHKVTLEEGDGADAYQVTVFIKPAKSKKKKCTIEELGKAKDEFISLYQRVYFSIRRTPIKCAGVSKDVVSQVSKTIKDKHANVCFFAGTTSDEIIVCAEESIADDVIRGFRNHAGLSAKQRLTKSVPGESENIGSSIHRISSNHQKTGSTSTSTSVTTEASAQRYSTSPSASAMMSPRSVPQAVDDGLKHTTPGGLKIYVVEDDITKLDVDAVVNPTDEFLQHNVGVARAIAAGAGSKLGQKCREIIQNRRMRGRGHGQLNDGEVIETEGFSLKPRYILHTPSPVYLRINSKNSNKEYHRKLAQTFETCLGAANDNRVVHSMAVPLIGAGNSGAPKDLCADALVCAIKQFHNSVRHLDLGSVVVVSTDAAVVDVVEKAIKHHFKTDMSEVAKNNVKESMDHSGKASPAASGKSRSVPQSLGSNKGRYLHASEDRNLDQYRRSESRGSSQLGAVPKQYTPSGTANQGMGSTSVGKTDEPGFISNAMNPIKNFFGYGEPTAGADHQSDEECSDSEPEIISAPSASNKREPPVEDKEHPSKRQPTCEKCQGKHDVKRLEACRHTFCFDCIEKFVVPYGGCTTCKALYCVAYEMELQGTMTFYTRTDLTLAGERGGSGVIEIIYDFPEGTVLSGGKSGRKYKGGTFQGYLPSSPEGAEVAYLLKRAFERGLTFAVKPNDRGGLEVTWSRNIPHKCNLKGGIGNHGYPDPDYLARMKDVLRKYEIVNSLEETPV